MRLKGFPLTGILVFIGLLIADQATKLLIFLKVTPYEAIPIIGNIVRITHVLNPGGAFSTRFGGNLFYVVVATLASGFIVIYIIGIRDQNRLLRISLFVILSGAIGNLVDRIRLGKVLDWIDIGVGRVRWPTFNVADMAIVAGLVIVFYAGVTNGRKSNTAESPGGNPPDEAGYLSG